MNSAGIPALDSLAASEQRAVVELLVASTVAASGSCPAPDLPAPDRERLVAALPDAAALHRLSGTVARGLACTEGVPDDVRSALVSERERSAVRHLVMVGALDQIRKALEAAGLSWIVMKGPVVAALLYPGVGERSYGDLDILVAGRDYPAAVAALESLGYRHDIHNWALAEEMLAGAVGMASPIAHADAHWHLHYSEDDRRQFSIRPDEMIGRARSVDVSGVVVPTFDAVDTLLTLGFHAARSGGHRLIWLKDIERSIAVDQPDLDELVRRCHRYGCATPVGLMLDRSRVVLGADVPVEIIDALVPGSIVAADRRLDHHRPWLRLHEDDTLARWLSRSARESVWATLGAMPSRSWRTAKRHLRPPAINESDDDEEKASFLAAVVTASAER